MTISPLSTAAIITQHLFHELSRAEGPWGQTPNDGGLRQPAAHAGLKASATAESPAEESASGTSKSPEQSENVIENKGSTAEGVTA